MKLIYKSEIIPPDFLTASARRPGHFFCKSRAVKQSMIDRLRLGNLDDGAKVPSYLFCGCISGQKLKLHHILTHSQPSYTLSLAVIALEMATENVIVPGTSYTSPIFPRDAQGNLDQRTPTSQEQVRTARFLLIPC